MRFAINLHLKISYEWCGQVRAQHKKMHFAELLYPCICNCICICICFCVCIFCTYLKKEGILFKTGFVSFSLSICTYLYLFEGAAKKIHSVGHYFGIAFLLVFEFVFEFPLVLI